MKLVDKKTRKAIEKSVRKAMRKHGPALVAALASGLVSSLATLANTEAPRKRGKSNLEELVDRAKDTVTGNGTEKRRSRATRREVASHAEHDTEDAQAAERAATA